MLKGRNNVVDFTASGIFTNNYDLRDRSSVGLHSRYIFLEQYYGCYRDRFISERSRKIHIVTTDRASNRMNDLPSESVSGIIV